jgi:hypothetical protein
VFWHGFWYYFLQYQCEKRGCCFEKLRFAGDHENHLRCPACGKQEIRKRVSCVGTYGKGLGGICSSGASSRFS